jgi:hypothetical protein
MSKLTSKSDETAKSFNKRMPFYSHRHIKSIATLNRLFLLQKT